MQIALIGNIAITIKKHNEKYNEAMPSITLLITLPSSFNIFF